MAPSPGASRATLYQPDLWPEDYIHPIRYNSWLLLSIIYIYFSYFACTQDLAQLFQPWSSDGPPMSSLTYTQLVCDTPSKELQCCAHITTPVDNYSESVYLQAKLTGESFICAVQTDAVICLVQIAIQTPSNLATTSPHCPACCLAFCVLCPEAWDVPVCRHSSSIVQLGVTAHWPLCLAT